MITPSEMAANLLQAVPRQVTCKIHTHLPRQCDALTAFFALDIGDSHIKVVANNVDNITHCDIFGRCCFLHAQRLPNQLDRDRLIGCLGRGINNRECPFQLADIGLDMLGDQLRHAVWQVQSAKMGLLFDDGNAGFITGRIQSSNETPFESADQPFFQCC